MPSDQSAPSNQTFSTPVRIYWEDTDAGGIVYHANYLRYLERARSDWLRAAGIDQHYLQNELGCNFVVVSSMLNYRKPAVLGDNLLATATLGQVSKASFWFTQTVTRDGDVLVDAEIRAACIDHKTHKPRRVPSVIFEQLQRIE